MQCLPCRDANGRPLVGDGRTPGLATQPLAPRSRPRQEAREPPPVRTRRHWFDDRLSSSSEDDNEEEACDDDGFNLPPGWRAQRLAGNAYRWTDGERTVGTISDAWEIHAATTAGAGAASVDLHASPGRDTAPSESDDRLDDIDEVEPHDGDDNLLSVASLIDTLELAQGATDGERGDSTARRERGDSTARGERGDSTARGERSDGPADGGHGERAADGERSNHSTGAADAADAANGTDEAGGERLPSKGHALLDEAALEDELQAYLRDVELQGQLLELLRDSEATDDVNELRPPKTKPSVKPAVAQRVAPLGRARAPRAARSETSAVYLY